MRHRHARMSLVVMSMTTLIACQPDPEWANKEALRIGSPRANAAEIRERQTARFQVGSEERLLVEATQVLQDIGFTVEESVARYGVLAGSKERDATETGQVVGQIALSVALALLGARHNPVYDTDQVIRATLTTRRISASESQLRVSFERIVTTNQGTSRVEELIEPEFSEGFFERIRHGLARGA